MYARKERVLEYFLKKWQYEKGFPSREVEIQHTHMHTFSYTYFIYYYIRARTLRSIVESKIVPTPISEKECASYSNRFSLKAPLVAEDLMH